MLESCGVVKVDVTKHPSTRQAQGPPDLRRTCPLTPSTRSSTSTYLRSVKMKVLGSFVSSLLLSGATIVSAASSWSFEDATVSISSKGAGVGAGEKDK